MINSLDTLMDPELFLGFMQLSVEIFKQVAN
jgi:hypothetical protein